jgi:hypothetical protein
MGFRQGGVAGYGVAVSWPEDADGLLAGPRGRRLCWALVGQSGVPGQAGIGPAWDQVTRTGRLAVGPSELAGELGVAVAQRDWPAVVAGMSGVALVAGPLAESVTWAMYWQPPDGVDRALADPQVTQGLRPVARAVTGAPAARWWSGGPDLGAQQYVQPAEGSDAGPALSGAAGRLAAWLTAEKADERAAAARPSDPAANYSGHWWSAPALSGLVSTTRALPGLGALQLTATEDWPGWSDVRCWPLSPRRAPRTWEITGPGDWAALVARYPLEVSKSRRHDWWRVTGQAGRWLIPDYAAAAVHYDAIHLSISGYLTTAGRALPAGEARTMLAGWSPDETYWLADTLTATGPPHRWICQNGRWQRWPPDNE